MKLDVKMNGRNQRNLTIIFWIFFYALFLRISWLQLYQDSPMFDFPLLDFTHFDQRARELLEGKWFSEEYLFNPLYALFLSVIYKVLGTDLFYPRLIQSLLGAFSSVFVYGIGMSVFNKRTAVFSAVLVASYLPLIYYDGLLLATSLITFLILLVVWLLLREQEKSSLILVGLSGFLMGIVVLGRPNFLLLAFAFLPWFLRFDTKEKFFKSCGRYLVFLTFTIAVLSPITIKYWLSDHEFVVVARHGGINFYIGNHPEATGAYMSIPGISNVPGQQVIDSQKIASQRAGRQLSSAEVSKFWMNRSLDFFKHQPIKATGLILRKTGLFWNIKELPSEYSLDFDKKFHWFLALPLPRFSTIGPLGILGLFCVLLGSKQEKSRSLIVYLVVFSIMTAVIMFFVHARYRMAVTPWLCLLSGKAIDSIFHEIARRNWSKMIVYSIALVCSVLFCNLPIAPVQESSEAEDLPGYNNLAYSYYLSGKYEKSEELNRYILSRSESSKTRFLLAESLLAQGKPIEAEEHLRKAINSDPSQIDAILSLGALLNSQGRQNESLNLLKTAREFHQHDDRLNFNLAFLYYQRKEYDTALRLIDQIKLHQINEQLRGQVIKLRQMIVTGKHSYSADLGNLPEGQVVNN